MVVRNNFRIFIANIISRRLDTQSMERINSIDVDAY